MTENLDARLAALFPVEYEEDVENALAQLHQLNELVTAAINGVNGGLASSWDDVWIPSHDDDRDEDEDEEWKEDFEASQEEAEGALLPLLDMLTIINNPDWDDDEAREELASEFNSAFGLIKNAAQMEAKWGDAPTWNPVLNHLREIEKMLGL